MSRYRCAFCGKVHEESALLTENDGIVGEYNGVSCSKEWVNYICPNCKEPNVEVGQFASADLVKSKFMNIIRKIDTNGIEGYTETELEAMLEQEFWNQMQYE